MTVYPSSCPLAKPYIPPTTPCTSCSFLCLTLVSTKSVPTRTRGSGWQSLNLLWAVTKPCLVHHQAPSWQSPNLVWAARKPPWEVTKPPLGSHQTSSGQSINPLLAATKPPLGSHRTSSGQPSELLWEVTKPSLGCVMVLWCVSVSARARVTTESVVQLYTVLQDRPCLQYVTKVTISLHCYLCFRYSITFWA